MNRFPKILIIVLAVIIAIISFYFISGWFNIIPWTLLTLIIGYLCSNMKNAMLKGVLFGYFLFLTYILIGYKGNTDKTGIMRIIFFSLSFSLIGGAAGLIGTLTGYFIKKRITAGSPK